MSLHIFVHQNDPFTDIIRKPKMHALCIVTSPPEGVARYCFHPVCLCECLCVSLCMCVCVCVCVTVCPANILIFYFSATRRDIDLKLIQDTYRVVLDSLNKLTFIGQRSRSQGRYITF